MKKHSSKLLCVIFSIIVFSLQTSNPLLAADCAGEIKQINIAIAKGNNDEAKRLIPAATDINCKTTTASVSPLLEAVYYQHEEIVRMLIDKGADVNFKSEKTGLTALHLSALFYNYNISKALIDAGANVNAREQFSDSTPLILALASKQLNFTIIMLTPFVQNNPEESYGNDFPMEEYKEDVYNTIKLLVESGASLNEVGKIPVTPLITAVGNEAQLDNDELMSIINLLIDHGSTYNNCDKEIDLGPIYHVVRDSTIDILDLLIEKDKSIESNNCYAINSALQFVVKANRSDLVRILLKNNDLVNSKDDLGRTALHYVAYTDNADIAKLLIAAGAKINIKDKAKKTPLQLAKMNKSKKVVKLLGATGK